jgi:hypothetical protein
MIRDEVRREEMSRVESSRIERSRDETIRIRIHHSIRIAYAMK